MLFIALQNKIKQLKAGTGDSIRSTVASVVAVKVMKMYRFYFLKGRAEFSLLVRHYEVNMFLFLSAEETEETL